MMSQSVLEDLDRSLHSRNCSAAHPFSAGRPLDSSTLGCAEVPSVERKKPSLAVPIHGKAFMLVQAR